MKKFLIRAAIGLVVLVVLFVAGVAINFYVLHPKMRDAPQMTAPSTPEAIERGRYLATHVTGCVGCHSPIDESRPGDFWDEEKLLAGREFPVLPEFFPGRLVGPNITPDDETGIGRWTDGELARAIREGVSRDGRPLFPMMPYTNFKHLTDEDVLAIIAYLRSVPAVRQSHPQTEIDFPVSMFVRVAPAPLEGSPPPWPEDEVERGDLLLSMMGCRDCHTPFDKGEPVAGMELAGGNPFPGEYGMVYTSNITPDEATGIGAYTDEDLMRVFREGRGKDGRLLWVMPWSMYSGTEERDLRAVIAALRRARPISNAVPPPDVREEYVRRAEAAQAAATPTPPPPTPTEIPPANGAQTVPAPGGTAIQMEDQAPAPGAEPAPTAEPAVAPP